MRSAAQIIESCAHGLVPPRFASLGGLLDRPVRRTRGKGISQAGSKKGLRRFEQIRAYVTVTVFDGFEGGENFSKNPLLAAITVNDTDAPGVRPR